MDEKFGALRSLMQLSELGVDERHEVWQLMRDVYTLDRAYYLAVWVPYLEDFDHHWAEPWCTYRDLSVLKQDMEMAPFSWFSVIPWGFGEELVRLLGEMPHPERLRSLLLSQRRLTDALFQEMVFTLAFSEVLHLDLSSNFLTAQSMRHLQISRAFQGLEVLELRWLPLLGDEGVSWLSKMDIPLRHLTLGYVGCGDAGAKALSQAEGTWSLETLELSHNRIGVPGMQHLSSARGWAQLRRLNVASNSLNEQAAESLARASYFENLTHLDVSANCIGGGIAPMSRRPIALTSLNLTRTGLGPEHMHCILEMLEQQTLQELRLGSNKFDAVSACAFASSPHLYTLRSLDISNMELGVQGAQRLAASNLPYLRELHLSFTNLVPAVMEELVGAIWLEHIEHLDLSYNALGSRSVNALLGEMEMSKLLDLNLESTEFTDADLSALLQLDLRSLTTLDLQHNHLGPEGVRLLVQKDPWPSLRCIRFFGNEALDPENESAHLVVIGMLKDWMHRRDGRSVDLL